MDANDLFTYVNANTADNDYVEQCWDTAVVLVDTFVGDNFVDDTVLDRAYLQCGSELFHARQAPNGIAQYNEFNGAPVRIARDPLTAVYSLLAPFMVIGL